MATGTTDWGSTPPDAQVLARMLQKSFPDLYTRASYVSPYPAVEPATLQLRSEMLARTREKDVKQYMADFKAGDEFPPVFATTDLVFDGLHRLDAINRLRQTDKRHPDKWNTFHAIVFNFSYADAPAALRDQITMLIAKVNHKHGTRYTDGEIESLVASLVGDNSPADIARAMGIHVNTVKAVLYAKKGRDKAGDMGLDTSHISRTTMEKIGRRLPEFTEAPFRELVEVAGKTPITGPEVVHLMNRMAEAGTEERKVALVQAERASRAGQESAAERGDRVGSTLAQQARMHWAFFLAHKDDPTVLVELNELKAPEHLLEAHMVVSVLRKMAQHQANMESGSIQAGV